MGQLAKTDPKQAPGYQFRVHVTTDAAKIETQVCPGGHFASPQDVADAVELVRAVVERVLKECLLQVNTCCVCMQTDWAWEYVELVHRVGIHCPYTGWTPSSVELLDAILQILKRPHEDSTSCVFGKAFVAGSEHGCCLQPRAAATIFSSLEEVRSTGAAVVLRAIVAC